MPKVTNIHLTRGRWICLQKQTGLGQIFFFKNIIRESKPYIKHDNYGDFHYLYQSWAHRSYILSERSKAMSDLRFSEWKNMSVER
jgi:hypothetical protein